MKINHILLPTDLSQEALRPFESISSFATEQGARITLLSVVEDLKIIPHGAPLAPKQSAPELAGELNRARAAAEDQRASLSPELPVTVEVVASESIAEGIADWAEKNDVDLIALSTHGRTGFRHLVLGSVAESLLHLSHVPVLCFPRKD